MQRHHRPTPSDLRNMIARKSLTGCSDCELPFRRSPWFC
ncbi:hypothetical protein A2U01_0099946, partial [Trifolium medium]|nr:hypothetical protein [Trifolium medium]